MSIVSPQRPGTSTSTRNSRNDSRSDSRTDSAEVDHDTAADNAPADNAPADIAPASAAGMLDGAATSSPTARPHVDATALVRHGTRRVRSTRRDALARTLARKVLRRLDQGTLTVTDVDGTVESYGLGLGGLRADIDVVDERAWGALAREGSIGLGRGYVEGWWTSPDPTSVVRIAIQNLGGFDALRTAVAGVTRLPRDVAGVVARRLAVPDVRRRNRDEIAAHYDIGNDFFELFLDETLTYSCAVFATPDTSLADASRAKFDRLLDKIGVVETDHLLEIGTGWGGFAIHAATTRRCAVTTTTISSEQLRTARRRVAASGVDDLVTTLGDDWRDLSGTFDHAVSIEMIEAVDWRDYDAYFGRVAACLRPGGRFAMQAICLPHGRYQAAKHTEDFVKRFVFPGGMLPSVEALAVAASRHGLQLVDVEELSAHYAETLRRWRERFDERLDDVLALGLDERFCRLWRMYLAYCEAGFAERHCIVDQLVFADARWRPQHLELRPA